MAHSPGPWRWNDDYIYDAHGYTVISGQEWSIANEDDRALIASAPDIAADLAEAVRLLRVTEWGPEMGVNSERHCNDCGMAESEGHAPGCKLAAFLARVDAR